MFKNYFVTSLRHIKKSKVNFIFKLGGLALAIFSFLAIAIYVSHQLSFDTHHRGYENIYRVNSERKENGASEKYGFVPLALGPTFKQYLPEVDAYARTRFANGAYLRHEGKSVDCGGLIEADSSFFDLLTFQFIEGNENALNEPNAIVLTRTKAMELFGETNVRQKIITINNEKVSYQITAVIEDPKHTAFGFEAVILNKTEAEFTPSSVESPVEFIDESATLFVRLNKPVTSQLKSKVESLIDRFLNKATRMETGYAVSFQPINEIYLGSQLKAEFARKGNSTYVYAFSVLAVLLLIVAAINYVNLSIADFSSRARETGVRKVLGARKFQLMIQVALETIIVSSISICVSVFFLYLFFPQITSLLDSDLRFEMLLDTKLLIAISFSFGLLIFLSSWFPARQFARSKVIQNLKSKGGGYNSWIGQILLFTQFSISAICIACTIVMEQQVGFIHNKDLGIDRKNLLVFGLPEGFSVAKIKVLKEKLKGLPGVTAVSNSSFRIGGGYWKDWYYVESKDGVKNVELYEVFSDDELFTTLGIKLLDGRTFDATIPSDSGAAFVINETAARELGWDDPVGKRIYTHPEEKGKWDGTVVGVVSDINISPLYDRVRPLVMRLPWQNQYPDFFVYVRYQGEEKKITDAIGNVYKEINPGYPFAYVFVDQFYNGEHQKENKAFASLQSSTFIILLVSMLGIFSMAAFMSGKRMKEFGIRKVLGASVNQIMGLHIGYFLKLVFISNLVALPIAYFLLGEWLDTFAYRVSLTYMPFLIVGMISFLIVIFSGGYSAWRSGRMNPIEVIKME
jgi:putative ABC transport system permease protein